MLLHAHARLNLNSWLRCKRHACQHALIQPQRCRFVHFSGPKGELPKGDDGTYGTQMTYHHAMDPGSDVLVAYQQNGQYLHPDHGFPCRMLIPGWIGGRMVKWLSHIHVSSDESENWYHQHDNKVWR